MQLQVLLELADPFAIVLLEHNEDLSNRRGFALGRQVRGHVVSRHFQHLPDPLLNLHIRHRVLPHFVVSSPHVSPVQLHQLTDQGLHRPQAHVVRAGEPAGQQVLVHGEQDLRHFKLPDEARQDFIEFEQTADDQTWHLGCRGRRGGRGGPVLGHEPDQDHKYQGRLAVLQDPQHGRVQVLEQGFAFAVLAQLVQVLNQQPGEDLLDQAEQRSLVEFFDDQLGAADLVDDRQEVLGEPERDLLHRLVEGDHDHPGQRVGQVVSFAGQFLFELVQTVEDYVVDGHQGVDPGGHVAVPEGLDEAVDLGLAVLLQLLDEEAVVVGLGVVDRRLAGAVQVQAGPEAGLLRDVDHGAGAGAGQLADLHEDLRLRTWRAGLFDLVPEALGPGRGLGGQVVRPRGRGGLVAELAPFGPGQAVNVLLGDQRGAGPRVL